MEKISLNNGVMQGKLHYCAMYLFKQIALYNPKPQPDVSFRRLREKMAMATPTVDRTNTIDYTERYPNFQIKDAVLSFVGAMNKSTGTENWYVSEFSVQPKKWGWTAWNNSHLKSRKFIRFIYNRSTGYTLWVDNGKSKQIPDQHQGNNWTILAGEMTGEQWLCDRNTGLHTPRFILELSIPNKNVAEWEKAKELIRNV
jgi:hypothetical protein